VSDVIAHCPKCGKFAEFNWEGTRYVTTGHLWWKKSQQIPVYHFYCGSCDHYFKVPVDERLR